MSVYSIEKILLNLGYKKEDILKNVNNDAWLQTVEQKHHLEKQSLVNPSEYYLFIEDSEKYHNDPNWKNYYNNLKNEFKKEKDSTNIEP